MADSEYQEYLKSSIPDDSKLTSTQNCELVCPSSKLISIWNLGYPIRYRPKGDSLLNNILKSKESQYNPDDLVLLDQEQFLIQLHNYACGLTDLLFIGSDGKKLNSIICAGAILNILNFKIRSDPVSDIDLYLWGPNQKEDLDTILSNLKSKYSILVYQREMKIFTVIIRGISRNIQIILTGLSSISEIFDKSETDVTRIGYCPEFGLLADPRCLTELETQTVSYKYPDLIRINKYHRKGFDVEILVDEVKGSEVYKRSDLITNPDKILSSDQRVLWSMDKYIHWIYQTEANIDLEIETKFSTAYSRYQK